jgi:hypothetical protein
MGSYEVLQELDRVRPLVAQWAALGAEGHLVALRVSDALDGVEGGALSPSAVAVLLDAAEDALGDLPPSPWVSQAARLFGHVAGQCVLARIAQAAHAAPRQPVSSHAHGTAGTGSRLVTQPATLAAAFRLCARVARDPSARGVFGPTGKRLAAFWLRAFGDAAVAVPANDFARACVAELASEDTEAAAIAIHQFIEEVDLNADGAIDPAECAVAIRGSLYDELDVRQAAARVRLDALPAASSSLLNGRVVDGGDNDDDGGRGTCTSCQRASAELVLAQRTIAQLRSRVRQLEAALATALHTHASPASPAEGGHYRGGTTTAAAAGRGKALGYHIEDLESSSAGSPMRPPIRRTPLYFH